MSLINFEHAPKTKVSKFLSSFLSSVLKVKNTHKKKNTERSSHHAKKFRFQKNINDEELIVTKGTNNGSIKTLHRRSHYNYRILFYS